MVPCGSRYFRLLYVNMLYSIQVNSFSVIKNSKTIKKVRICTQQDGGGTTKSKSLKMLYPFYK